MPREEEPRGKLAQCGCGGEGHISWTPSQRQCFAWCRECLITTKRFDTETAAVTAWNVAMSRAALPSAPAESGWLIEAGDSPVSRPRYWIGIGEDEEGETWSEDHNQAIRFGRQIDGEKAAQAMGWNNYRVCEHGWG